MSKFNFHKWFPDLRKFLKSHKIAHFLTRCAKWKPVVTRRLLILYVYISIKKDHIVDTTFRCSTTVWRSERRKPRFPGFIIFSMIVFLTMLQKCFDTDPSSQRILTTMRRSRDDSATDGVLQAKKKDHIVGSLLLACHGVLMLMKYIGLQKSHLRIFYPPPPLGLLFSFVFLVFFSIGKL